MSFYPNRPMTGTMGTMGRTTAAPPFYGTTPMEPFFDYGTFRDQTVTTAPTFPPFKFEPKRARIDWRLLHGIDINAIVRDVDLDVLEKIVNIVAYGDIEAEDTRHLTELNFIKIFRLAQMMIEYLLYVQECLQNSNTWLQTDRANMDKYVQAARLRIRELDTNYKMTKRELRRSRKTIKTYEMLAVLNDGKLRAAEAPAPAPPPPPPPAPAPPPKPESNAVASAMEALLRKEMSMLADRLSRATVECQQLRSERDEMYSAIKDIDAAVRARGDMAMGTSPAPGKLSMETVAAMQGMQDQLSKATAEITKLRNEKSELAEELDRANSDRRQLQDEKSKLLTEVASRPLSRFSEPFGGQDGVGMPAPSDNLGGMLLDAERQKQALQDQLEESKREIAQLQKQLMKAMKATALAPLGAMPSSSGGADESLQLRAALRDAEMTRSQLEKDLADMRKMYNDDVQQLQSELEMTQARAVDADRQLSALRASGPGPSPVRASPGAGGLVKVTEERRASNQLVDEDEKLNFQARIAEYEAVNERLNQQIDQLKRERGTLASDVDRLRLQLEARSPARQQAADQAIEHTWKMEEIERLRREALDAQARSAELQQAVADREAHIDRLRATIRDLQAQLAEAQGKPPVDPAVGRVRQQVAEFEQKGGASGHFKTQSFSFLPEAALPAHDTRPSTPTSSTPTPTPLAPPLPLMQPPSPPPPSSSQPVTPRASRWLQRSTQPSPADAAVLRHNILSRVAGMKPEQLDMMLAEEIRVITENPYEFEDDDEAQFRALLPHELSERHGVLSAQQHTMRDLERARQLFTEQLLSVADDEVAKYGMDPRPEAMSDKDYASNMLELAARRNATLQRFPKEQQERAERLRDALLTHLELIKRQAQQEALKQQQAALQAQQQQALQQAAERAASVVSGEITPEGASSGGGASPPKPVLQMAPTFGKQPSISGRSDRSGVSGEGSQQDASTPTAAVPVAVQRVGPPAGGVSRVPSGHVPDQVQQFGASQPEASPLNRSIGGRPSNPSNLNASLSSIASSTANVPVRAVQPHPAGAPPPAAAPVQPVQLTLAPAAPTPAGGPSAQGMPVPQRIVLGGASGGGALPAAGNVGGAGQAGGSGGGAGGGNLNMSIRSKYQDSDFDDEDEIPSLPQPKAIKRVADEDDEYAVTEDEEALEEGIDSEEDAGGHGPGPKLMIRSQSPPRSVTAAPAAPSRLGPGGPARVQPPVSASKGWATDEPLQAAPPPPAPAPVSREPTDTAEIESIRSFNDTMSTSLPRRPGAWDTGNTSFNKQKQKQGAQPEPPRSSTFGREQAPSGKTSGWGDGTIQSIQSFNAASNTADEIQQLQDVTSLQSFTESIRPARGDAASGGAGGAFQRQPSSGARGAGPAGGGGGGAAAGGKPAAAARRDSFDTDITEIEYM